MALGQAGQGLAAVTQLARHCGVPVAAVGPDPAADNDGAGLWPAGVNDYSCKATPGGPAPVLLLPGMLVPGELFYWVRLAPGLQAAGHCVFAMELPALATATPSVGAHAVKQKLATIRAATGYPDPAVVTYSVGAIYARQAIREGDTEISHLVTLAGQNNGFSPAVATLINFPVLHQAVGLVCPMCIAMAFGSPYLRDLAAADTARLVPTTTLSSRLDWASVPEDNAVPGARNLVLQDLCSSDLAGHLTGEWSAQALEVTVAALANREIAPLPAPYCGLGLPL
ncbi:alpha/beta fold hydrolase [Nocardia sp. NPDC055029]